MSKSFEEKLDGWLDNLEHNKVLRFIGKTIGTVLTIILVPIVLVYALKASAYILSHIIPFLEKILKALNFL